MTTLDAESAGAGREEQMRAEVRLASVFGIGPTLRRRLVERCGSAAAVFATPPATLASVPGVGRRLAQAIAEAAAAPDADEIVAACRREGIAIVSPGMDGYPALLTRIDDPPAPLFVRGDIVPADALAIAVVGARHATPYGVRTATRLAGGLARAGYTIVSGLARGIDAAAHRGALEAGGRTLAVLGSGVLSIYPPEHEGLAAQVAAQGAVLAEAPPYTAPCRGAFPQRNRIIAGLVLGVVVVEAGERSGSLITARLAADQGREVFAVPGRIDCTMARGCHRLIRDGARLVESVDDILEELGPLFEATTTSSGRTISAPAELRLDEVERRTLDAVDGQLDGGVAGIDDVVAASGLATAQVLAALGVLEMRRLVRRLPGNRVERT